MLEECDGEGGDGVDEDGCRAKKRADTHDGGQARAGAGFICGQAPQK
jgi:hypothetical protein